MMRKIVRDKRKALTWGFEIRQLRVVQESAEAPFTAHSELKILVGRRGEGQPEAPKPFPVPESGHSCHSREHIVASTYTSVVMVVIVVVVVGDRVFCILVVRGRSTMT